jgi:CHAT domain-containing protein
LPDAGSSLAALSLSDGVPPKTTILGLTEPIDSLVLEYKRQFAKVESQEHLPTTVQTSEFRTITNKLYNFLIKPIPNISDSVLLLISPDGSLSIVSFSTLTSGKGEFLIESNPIHYLSAARDLVRRPAAFESTRQLVTFADPAIVFTHTA